MNIKIVLLLTYVVIAIAGNSKSIEHFKYTEQREKINIEDNVRRYKTKTLKNVNYEWFIEKENWQHCDKIDDKYRIDPILL